MTMFFVGDEGGEITFKYPDGRVEVERLRPGSYQLSEFKSQIDAGASYRLSENVNEIRRNVQKSDPHIQSIKSSNSDELGDSFDSRRYYTGKELDPLDFFQPPIEQDLLYIKETIAVLPFLNISKTAAVSSDGKKTSDPDDVGQ